jgi:hypothetical protein
MAVTGRGGVMVLFDGFVGILAFGLWIFCIIDVITTPPDRVRNLPKIAWLLIVLLLVDVGSIVWLIAGRWWDRASAAPSGTPRGARRTPPRARPTNPDDDEEFLASLRARAEEQRRRAREADQDPDAPPAG